MSTSFVFIDGKWMEKSTYNEFNTVLLMDTDEKSLYLYEGSRCSTFNRSDARNAIGELKTKFPNFKLKKIDKDTPKNILNDLKSKKRVIPNDLIVDSTNLVITYQILSGICIIFPLLALILRAVIQWDILNVSILIMVYLVIQIVLINLVFISKYIVSLISVSFGVLLSLISVFVLWTDESSVGITPMIVLPILMVLSIIPIIIPIIYEKQNSKK